MQPLAKAVELAQADTNTHRLALSRALLNRSRLYLRLGRLAEAGRGNCRARGIPQRDPQSGPNLIDLGPFFNAALNDELMNGRWPQNSLAGLPAGRHRLGGVDFDVRDALQGSRDGWSTVAYPDAVRDIRVNRSFQRLHCLHGTSWQQPDGTKIGAYVLCYIDGKKLELPIVYGQDVRDWGDHADRQEATRATVAWTGQNSAASGLDVSPRLYQRTWDNPRPDVEVQSIDFLSTMTECAPFLIALTVE